MMTAKQTIKTEHFEFEVHGVHDSLKNWRASRSKGERIPETIWQAMAELARIHGVSRVSHLLGVDYHGLKKRVQPASANQSKAPVNGFVELSPSPSLPTPPGCVVELEDRCGSKMTFRLNQGNRADVLALAQAFWRKGR